MGNVAKPFGHSILGDVLAALGSSVSQFSCTYTFYMYLNIHQTCRHLYLAYHCDHRLTGQ